MYEKQVLEGLLAEKREKREKSLAHLPEIYKSQIQSILVGSSLIFVDNKTTEKKRQAIKAFKEELEKNNIANGYSREIFNCLEEIDDVAKHQEAFYYKKRILVNSFFERLRFFISHPLLTEMRTIIKKMDSTAKYLTDPINKLSIEQLKKLDAFSKEDEETEALIKNIIRECVSGFSEYLLIDYSKNIDENQKEKIIANAQEVFPEIGNNKLLFFSRPNQVKYLDQEFKKHMFTIFQEFYKDYVSYNMDKYRNISNLLQDVFISISLSTKDGSLDEIYLNYAQQYINDFFAKTLEKRNNQPTKSEGPNLSDLKIINESLHYHMPKRSIKPEILEGIGSLLSEITTTKENKEEIRRIFLKRFFKKTEIRLYDLQQKFAIDTKDISPSTIKYLQSAGCNFRIDMPKEKTKELPTPESKEPIEQKPEGTISEYKTILENLRKEGNIQTILEHYGFTINNPKRFQKQIDKLYPTQKDKDGFLDDLKISIEKTKKRTILEYRTIDLRAGRRILILNKTEIDGIYHHEDYTNRVANILNN